MVYTSNTAPEPLNWDSYFWWVDSRSKTAGLGMPMQFILVDVCK